MDIVQNIMDLIKERKTTAYAVSKATGISSGNFSDWKSGKAKPSQKAIQKIADYFDVSVDYLLGREPSSETKKDGNAEALPPDASLTPYQKQLIEFAESLTEEEVKKVLSYIRFVLSERDGK